MTDPKLRLTRRVLLGTGFALPVSFVQSAAAQDAAPTAYNSESGPVDNNGEPTGGAENGGQQPVQLNPGAQNATGPEFAPSQGGGAAPAGSAFQQLQNLTNGSETTGQGYDNGRGPDDTTVNAPTPEPPTPEAQPVEQEPAAVLNDQQYQQLSSQADQADAAASAAAQQAQQVQQQWDAVKSDPNASSQTLTNTYNQLQQAESQKTWTTYKAQQADDAKQQRAKQVISVLDAGGGSK